MDLSTVGKNISSGKYATLLEAADDIRLIWKNCQVRGKRRGNGCAFIVRA